MLRCARGCRGAVQAPPAAASSQFSVCPELEDAHALLLAPDCAEPRVAHARRSIQGAASCLRVSTTRSPSTQRLCMHRALHISTRSARASCDGPAQAAAAAAGPSGQGARGCVCHCCNCESCSRLMSLNLQLCGSHRCPPARLPSSCTAEAGALQQRGERREGTDALSCFTRAAVRRQLRRCCAPRTAAHQALEAHGQTRCRKGATTQAALRSIRRPQDAYRAALAAGLHTPEQQHEALCGLAECLQQAAATTIKARAFLARTTPRRPPSSPQAPPPTPRAFLKDPARRRCAGGHVAAGRGAEPGRRAPGAAAGGGAAQPERRDLPPGASQRGVAQAGGPRSHEATSRHDVAGCDRQTVSSSPKRRTASRS